MWIRRVNIHRSRNALKALSYPLSHAHFLSPSKVRQAERSMVQVAALSQTFAAHVAAQAEQIEQLCAHLRLLRCTHSGLHALLLP